MFNDAFNTMFDTSELDALSKCNQFGRFPILPLSTLEPSIVDGNSSDDSCSPTTPLDAYNLTLHTLAYQKVDPFATQYNQCLPMSALYISPPQLPSDAESASTTDSSSPDSEHALLPATTPIVPSQASPNSKKRASPSDESDGSAPSAAKKPRVSAARIRAKDFIPPDVSGLNKREARLVKNRAAAFLSRQRKREEFEAMEIRLAELERENADLRRGTGESASSPSPASPSSTGDSLEPMELQLSSMRQMLQEAKEREASLRKELQDASRSSSPSSSADAPKEKTRASLGLMAVLSLSSVLRDSADSSWARGLAAGDSIAFCNGETGVPELEVSCTPCTDGKMRVRLHRASEQAKNEDLPWSFDSPSSLGFMDDANDAFSLLPTTQKRMRVALASAEMRDDGAELQIEIR
ncbi:hypothetical protein EXIGLDRAFT_831645 [Exidia glandulosa HHB12029]|uniref:BZIP domain-containing protein n=1 Tax=Exidia glandulosa HHB12029 TaxID=1314781 RepID=A0A165MIJ4_EXIGL|nr:hypothetical protein EXIGLDRAFT_831645 [Exidia glandulosa HHB12029]